MIRLDHKTKHPGQFVWWFFEKRVKLFIGGQER